MEKARMTNPSGHAATQATRAKPAVQGKDSLADTQGNAGSGGFMALLVALGDGGLQDMSMQPSVAHEPPQAEPATPDTAAQMALQGGALSWQWQATVGGGAVPEAIRQGSATQENTAQAAAGAAITGLPGQGLMAVPDGLSMPSAGPAVAGQAPAADGVASVSAPDGRQPAGSFLQPIGAQNSLLAKAVPGQAVPDGLVLRAVGPAATGPASATDAVAHALDAAGLQGEGSLLLQTALQDGAVEPDARGAMPGLPGLPGAAVLAGGRKMPGRPGGGVALAVDASPAAGVPGAGPVGAKGQSVSMLQGASFQPLVVERRDAGELVREGVSGMEPAIEGGAATMVPWAVDTPAGPRGLVRGSEAGAALSGAGGATEPSHERLEGAVGEWAAVNGDPAMTPAEDAVAEQVAYWVHQNIQNARLTVKHEGQPVEVSVSLTGNEAHVSFGSDEAQTRDLLDGSVAQLRDMLRQEGLVLSGVSVGESGRQRGDEGAGAGDPSGRRRPAGVAAPVAAAQVAVRPGVVGDRAVDIFV